MHRSPPRGEASTTGRVSCLPNVHSAVITHREKRLTPQWLLHFSGDASSIDTHGRSGRVPGGPHAQIEAQIEHSLPNDLSGQE